MINFHFETDFELRDAEVLRTWIIRAVASEKFTIEEINFIFCTDAYLHNINVEFLNHDTLTDVIGFDYSVGKRLQGDIFISVERVLENAALFHDTMENELRRVMIHGLLHFMGMTDKTPSERDEMRRKEDDKLSMFHVEQ